MEMLMRIASQEEQAKLREEARRKREAEEERRMKEEEVRLEEIYVYFPLILNKMRGILLFPHILSIFKAKFTMYILVDLFRIIIHVQYVY